MDACLNFPRFAALTGLLLACAGPVAAQVADAELLRCAKETEAAGRLACFDALAAGAAIRQTPAGKQAAVMASFGAQTAADNTAAIETEFEGLLEGWGPNTHFRLKNGHVWRVVDNSSATLYLQNPKVTIRRAALGSFLMEFAGTRETVRVRRQQ
jgi:hypothetical protein